MRRKLLNMYHELKESGSTSDFPNLLANTMFKILIDKFKGVNSPWRQYTMKSNLSDFKTADRVIVGESPDLLEIDEGAPYTDSELVDDKYQIGLKTYGRTFTISRQVIINDDLNAMQRAPQKLGKASARTLIKKIIDGIEGDGNTYDNKSLFHADHSNSGNTTLANTAAGAKAVADAVAAIENSTEPNSSEKMGITAKFLLVPTALRFIAEQLVSSAQILPAVGDGGGTRNVISQLTVLSEPFLTSSTGWYVMADPEDAPVIEVGFLDGKEEPDLLVKKAEAASVAGGGEDPYGYEFDDISYKVRHDWAIARGMYQGIYRGKA